MITKEKAASSMEEAINELERAPLTLLSEDQKRPILQSLIQAKSYLNGEIPIPPDLSGLGKHTLDVLPLEHPTGRAILRALQTWERVTK